MRATAFPVFEIESRWLSTDEFRLNASSFSPEAADSLALIDELKRRGAKVDIIGNVVDRIFYPGRFKRDYAKTGTAFLSSKDIFDLVPTGKRIRNPTDLLFVKPGWVLVTRSGSVGRVCIATKMVSQAAISEHVIRVVPDGRLPASYLYIFLISRFGQPLIIKNIFGGVVDEIEPHHIGSICIPRIPRLENMIDEKVKKAVKVRQEAQEMLAKAEEEMHAKLRLPHIVEDDITYIGDRLGRIARCFETSLSDLELRMDAPYHSPLAQVVIRNLAKSRTGKMKRLRDVATSFVPPRFKRAYVSPPDGIPLLQGTHVPQAKPQDVKVLWKDMKKLKKYLVKEGWILVTCSGTIGEVSMIAGQQDGWAATNHLLRIVPDRARMHPGYLALFLRSVYGWAQFQRLIYGGVVDEIAEAGDLADNVTILKPSNEEVEKEIGDMVVRAYQKRDEANSLEDDALSMLETAFEKLRSSPG
ncbi:MAG: hypothetical protein JRN35_08345 [Nitrososphaerota archaeon]|nr:hypothetical protein [Nitrososphaerota archaeon]